VVRTHALTENLDEIYAKLMDFEAMGGGDEPEDVRQALHTAVNKINWSKARSGVSRIVFLVGDARPHTDYQDFPTTVATAKAAAKRGIVINTIQCGNLGLTEKYWRQIADNTNGQYFRIAQDGGTRAVTTPYDEQLRSLGDEIDRVYIPFGKEEERAVAIMAAADRLGRIKSGSHPEAAAARTVNKSLNRHAYSSDDLIQALENKEIRLKDIEKSELPAEMQAMTPAERENYVQGKIAERGKIREQIVSVSRKRDAWIKAHAGEKTDSFDQAVSDALKEQIK